MIGYSIGLSALAAGRRGMDLVGQNIANATTPGYHRQVLNLTSRTTTGTTGTGVDVSSITRFDTPPVRTAMLRGNADQAAAAARLDVARQVETSLGSGSGTVGDGIESFFRQVQELTTRPDDPGVRRPVIAAAATVAGRLNAAAGDISRLRADVGGQIATTVAEVNDLAGQIAGLNARIAGIVGQGGQPHELIDQRGQLLDQLSQRVDVRTVAQPSGGVTVVASGAALVVGDQANAFAVGPDAAGQLVVTQSGSARPVAFASGKLAGQLQAYNVDLPATRGRLDGLATALVQRVNQVQATGLGTGGPQATAAGTVSVPDPATPLGAQTLPFPVRAGTLTISVTAADGTRTNTAVAIDPATQSLQDVAAAITGGTGSQVQASVDPTTHTLRFQAAAGVTFDFAGRGPNPAGGAAAVADPDTANLLSALGVNGLFAGTDAASVAVNPAVLADPGRLAASRTGQPGDATNLERLVAVRDQAAVGGRTLTQGYADLAGAVGADVKSLDDVQSSQEGLLQSLAVQEQGVVGVDQNEELVHLLDYQRMVESASRYLSVVNAALDSVFQILN